MNEEWKQIEGFESLYKVSNTGKVYSFISERQLKGEIHWKGHHKVVLYRPGNGLRGKKYFVHRLVAIAFIPQLDKSRDVVNHKDGNKLNNCVENLEWVTMTENTQHYFRELRNPVEDFPDIDF